MSLFNGNSKKEQKMTNRSWIWLKNDQHNLVAISVDIQAIAGAMEALFSYADGKFWTNHSWATDVVSFSSATWLVVSSFLFGSPADWASTSCSSLFWFGLGFMFWFSSTGAIDSPWSSAGSSLEAKHGSVRELASWSLSFPGWKIQLSPAQLKRTLSLELPNKGLIRKW